jgi:hypothetical protein
LFDDGEEVAGFVEVDGDNVALERRATGVADGGFPYEFSAPSAGRRSGRSASSPPVDAYAVMTWEPGGATRWSFWSGQFASVVVSAVIVSAMW